MADMHKKKILFTDIDDTLVTTDKKLTDESRQAIEDFLAAGNIFAISTGRALSGASNLMKDIGFYGRKNTYICAFNGGQIFDTCKEETLYKKALSDADIRLADEWAHDFKIHLQAYTDTAVITESYNGNLQKYCDINRLPYEIVSDLADAAPASCKLLAIDYGDPELVTRFRTFLLGQKLQTMDIFMSNQWLLEIVPKGVSKGAALHFLANHLNIPIAYTISAGDQENDLPMIVEAGVGCAMANAVDALKSSADYITENDNNHSGIAEIIRKFG